MHARGTQSGNNNKSGLLCAVSTCCPSSKHKREAHTQRMKETEKEWGEKINKNMENVNKLATHVAPAQGNLTGRVGQVDGSFGLRHRHSDSLEMCVCVCVCAAHSI